MPSGGHGKQAVVIDGVRYISITAAKQLLGISFEHLKRLMKNQFASCEAHGWPAWFPKPLDPDHRKRLDAWCRTLPGTKHTPWRSEAAQAREVAKRGGAYRAAE